MSRKATNTRISRRIGKFEMERRLILIAIAIILGFACWVWIDAHPEHNPSAPLDLRDPIGLATATKLVSLRGDIPECRAVLERSEVSFDALEPAGEGNCARRDRTRLAEFPLSPNIPATTCPIAAALELWRTRTVKPAAREIFGSPLARIEHLGVYNCRRIRGAESGSWSQHATGNAIDISAFVLEDGTRIALPGDWEGDDAKARFLRRVRDGACGVFATVLSPDYNAAHADHFHFDQDGRWLEVCR